MGCSCFLISSSVNEPVLANDSELALYASSILEVSLAIFPCCTSIQSSRSASSSFRILLEASSSFSLTLFFTSLYSAERFVPFSLDLRSRTSLQKDSKEVRVQQNLGVNTSKWAYSFETTYSFFSSFFDSPFSAFGARFPIIYKMRRYLRHLYIL